MDTLSRDVVSVIRFNLFPVYSYRFTDKFQR